MSSTNDIKPWLVQHFADKGQATRAADWKRRSKSRNDQGQVVRTFEHATLGRVDVVETPEGLALAGDGDELIERTSAGNPQNPLFDRFPPQPYEDEDLEEDEKDSPEDFMSRFSGRIVYSIDEIEETPWTDEMGVGLMCGFETSDGYIYDQHSDATEDMMRFVFADRVADETIGIGEAESAHSIKCREGETVEEVVAMIRARMRFYRVVDMDDPDYAFSEADCVEPGGGTGTGSVFVLKDATLETWKNTFKQAIKKDDLATFETLVPDLQALAAGPFSDTDARLRPLAQAALQDGAVAITKRLIELGAPLSLFDTYGRSIADMGSEWNMRLRKKPEQALEAILTIPSSSGWEPDKPVRGYRDFLGEELDRDAWADLVVMASSYAKDPIEWLMSARAALAARTGEEKATESFLRSYWAGMEQVSESAAKEWDEKMQEALDSDITFLDRYPLRDGWHGQALAAMTVNTKNEADFMKALEMSRQYGFDLANLKTETGGTVRQALQAEEKKAMDIMADERSRGFVVVMTDSRGNQSTRGGDAAIKLKMIRRHLGILSDGGGTLSARPGITPRQ